VIDLASPEMRRLIDLRLKPTYLPQLQSRARSERRVA